MGCQAQINKFKQFFINRLFFFRYSYLSSMNGYTNTFGKDSTPFKPYQMTSIEAEALDNRYEQNNVINYTQTTASPKLGVVGGSANEASDDNSGESNMINTNLLSQNAVLLTKREISSPDEPYNFRGEDIHNAVSPRVTPLDLQPIQTSYSVMHTMNGNNYSKIHKTNINNSMADIDMDSGGPKKRGRKKKVRTGNVE